MRIASDPFDSRVVRAAYDAVADDYEAAFAGDLERLPVDMEVLEDAVRRLRSAAPVVDLGCGPGQVGAFVADRGARVIGVDLAPRMLAIARRRNLDRTFIAADMRVLPFRQETVAAVVAYYSVQHVARSELAGVLAELSRLLLEDGVLVIATHLGEGEAVFDEFLGHQIKTAGGTFYRREELLDALAGAAFDIESVRERGPLEHEHQSQRIYVIARK